MPFEKRGILFGTEVIFKYCGENHGGRFTSIHDIVGILSIIYLCIEHPPILWHWFSSIIHDIEAPVYISNEYVIYSILIPASSWWKICNRMVWSFFYCNEPQTRNTTYSNNKRRQHKCDTHNTHDRLWTLKQGDKLLLIELVQSDTVVVIKDRLTSKDMLPYISM